MRILFKQAILAAAVCICSCMAIGAFNRFKAANYSCTEQEYAVIDSMYNDAMEDAELRQDFKMAYPTEYSIMMQQGELHDCVECRLKALASCFDDAIWGDKYDDENEECISNHFLKVVYGNPSLRGMFNAALQAQRKTSEENQRNG